MAFVVVSELLLYVCVSLLMGSFIVRLLPTHTRPNVHVERTYMTAAAAGTGIFSFVPVLVLIVNLQATADLQDVLPMVLLTFEIGKAWIFTASAAVFLVLFIFLFYHRTNPVFSWTGCFLTLLLILGLSWSTHAGSLAQISGVLNHAIHFTAVSVWIGILFVVSWFAKDYTNWLNFLNWFTMIAIMCVVFITASGMALMTVVMDVTRYLDSWMLSYGQLLLLKHLLFAAVLLFAVINGILMRWKIKNDQFNPLPWTKAESSAAIVIFSVTAALGQQTPPNADEISNEGFPALLDYFYQGQYQMGMTLQLHITAPGMSLFAIALLFAAMVLYAFIKNAPALITFLLSLFFVFSAYIALLMSIS
jgi:copper resistance protein D